MSKFPRVNKFATSIYYLFEFLVPRFCPAKTNLSSHVHMMFTKFTPPCLHFHATSRTVSAFGVPPLPFLCRHHMYMPPQDMEKFILRPIRVKSCHKLGFKRSMQMFCFRGSRIVCTCSNLSSHNLGSPSFPISLLHHEQLVMSESGVRLCLIVSQTHPLP